MRGEAATCQLLSLSLSVFSFTLSAHTVGASLPPSSTSSRGQGLLDLATKDFEKVCGTTVVSGIN